MRFPAIVLLLTAWIQSAPLAAGDLRDESADFQATAILDNLNNPWGIALRPSRLAAGQFEVYVAESGAGRVIRFTSSQPESHTVLVAGFPTESFSDHLPVQVGPFALACITRTKLAVSLTQKQEVRVYSLPTDEQTLQEDQFEHVAQSLRTASEPHGSGIQAIAATDTVAYLATNSSAPDSRLLRAEISANRLKRLVPFSKYASAEGILEVGGLTVSPSDRPSFLVISRQIEGGQGPISYLVFLTTDRGKEVLRLATELTNITALAYSPSGRLYAVNSDWGATGQGGVYRLDDARQEGHQICRAVKIAKLTRPVALVFASNSMLLVTALGSEEDGMDGSVWKVNGNF